MTPLSISALLSFVLSIMTLCFLPTYLKVADEVKLGMRHDASIYLFKPFTVAGVNMLACIVSAFAVVYLALFSLAGIWQVFVLHSENSYKMVFLGVSLGVMLTYAYFVSRRLANEFVNMHNLNPHKVVMRTAHVLNIVLGALVHTVFMYIICAVCVFSIITVGTIAMRMNLLF